MTAGNEGGALLGGVRKLAGALDEKAPKGFDWKLDLMPGESHGSVPHRGTYRGLEAVFADYYLADVLATFDATGIDGVRRFYAASGLPFGYEREIPFSVAGELLGKLLAADRLEEAATILSEVVEGYVPPPPNALLVQAWTMLARGYARNNNEDRAIEFYRKILQAEPANEQAQRALSEIETNAE